MITITLPFPVSVNGMYANHYGKGRIKTGRYKSWQNEANGELLQQKPPAMVGPVSIDIRIKAPDARVRDGDNLVKCVFDLLKLRKVIPDDNNKIIKRHSVEWVEQGPPCEVTITEVC